MDIPPELKDVQHFIVLADQFQNSNLLVSYYLRQYALNQAQNMVSTKALTSSQQMQLSQQINQWSLMCAQMKQTNPEMFADVNQNKQEFTDYTMRILVKALDQEKKNQCTMETVQLFSRVSKLIEAINFFEPIDQQLKDKMKYSKNSAVKIAKMLKNPQYQQSQNAQQQNQMPSSQQPQNMPQQQMPNNQQQANMGTNYTQQQVQQQQPQQFQQQQQFPQQQQFQQFQNQPMPQIQPQQQFPQQINQYQQPQQQMQMENLSASELQNKCKQLLEHTQSELDFKNFVQARENVKQAIDIVSKLEKM